MLDLRTFTLLGRTKRRHELVTVLADDRERDAVIDERVRYLYHASDRVVFDAHFVRRR